MLSADALCRRLGIRQTMTLGLGFFVASYALFGAASAFPTLCACAALSGLALRLRGDDSAHAGPLPLVPGTGGAWLWDWLPEEAVCPPYWRPLCWRKSFRTWV